MNERTYGRTHASELGAKVECNAFCLCSLAPWGVFRPEEIRVQSDARAEILDPGRGGRKSRISDNETVTQSHV